MMEIGVIKWFYDKAKDGKYGFIENPNYISLFFHKSALDVGISEDSLKESTLVKFLAAPSKKHDEKWEAIKVSLVDVEKDADEVVNRYLDSFLDVYLQENFTLYLTGLKNLSKGFLFSARNTETILPYFSRFKDAVKRFTESEKALSKYHLANVLDIGNSLFPDFESDIMQCVSSKVTPEDHYYLWEKNHTRILPIPYLLESKALLDINKFSAIARKADTRDLVEVTILQLEEFLDGDQNSTYPNIKLVLEQANKVIPDFLKDIYERVVVKFNSSTEFNLWKERVIKKCSTAAIMNNWRPVDSKLTEELLKKSSEGQRKELALLFHKSILDLVQTNRDGFQLLLSFYSQIKSHLSVQYQKELVDSVRHLFDGQKKIQLWLQNFDDIPYEAILDEFDNSNMVIVDQILEKATSNESIKILEGLVFYRWESITAHHETSLLVKIKRSLNTQGRDVSLEIVERVCKIATIPTRIQLWLEEFHEILDFDLYKPFVITLPVADQQIFLKKVLNYIHLGRTSISIENLTSLNVVDYETAKEAEAIDGKRIDYSLSVVLHVIKSLYVQDNAPYESEIKKKLFEIILDQLKDPKDILEIRGFFDNCTGRATLKKLESKDDAGNSEIQYSIKRDEGKIPSYHSVCDGRKAREKHSKKPVLESDSGMEFWWCANQKCYQPCRSFKDSGNWRNYAIQDFLSILNISYKESELEIYLSMVNKVNRFLRHLKCRSCKHILYPTRQSNYAFHGVNHFHCVNESCGEKGKEIYLTHCLNGRCDNTIDSREAVRCKPEGFDQGDWGWYVCNDCHACCSTEKIEGRKYVAEVINKTAYKGHPVGHRDLGIVSCNKCGHAMNTFKPDVDEYQRILSWFVANKESSQYIEKFGKNKFGKWWFKLRAKNGDLHGFFQKLLKYKRIGFNVPDLAEGNQYQMVAEPINFSSIKLNELECQNCGNRIDLDEFPEKRYIMKGYYEKVSF